MYRWYGGTMKFIRSFLFIVGVCTLFSCMKKEVQFSEDGFQYISSITQSSIDRDMQIKVVFNEAIKNAQEISRAAVFSPEQKGAWELSDEKTITFTPEKYFAEKTEFTLSLDTGKLMNMGSNKIGVVQHFQVRPSKFEVNIASLISGDSETYSLEGSVETDIACSSDKVESALSAALGTNACRIDFEKNESSKIHRFKIAKIVRGNKNQVLEILYNAKKIGFDAEGKITREIPAAGSFQIIDVQQSNNKTVRFSFSENLDTELDLSEFINVVSDDTDYTYRWEFDRNTIKVVCSRTAWPDGTVISIYPNFKSAEGHLLNTGYEYKVIFGWEKPLVKFVDNNVILPTDGNAIVPIQTKNISGVIVEAVKIQTSNMLQFLQVNELRGDYQMYRVGESVWQKAFDFEWKPEMKNRLVTRGLDITELVKKYPDGMFQLRLTFARRHSQYENPYVQADSNLEFPADFVNFSRYPYQAYWDSIGNRKNEEDYWSSDDNPLHPAFYISSYNRNVLQEKNVLVSNLALAAKVDSSGSVYLQAVNLLTSQAEKNTEIKLYSFAQTLIETGNCDSAGRYTATAKIGDFAFIQAKSGNNYAYLNVQNAPLNTDNFKVGGVKSFEGVKGFVYGERGVWRPGDTLHLCLIVQDLQNALPKNVPVTFTLEDPMGKVIDKKVLSESVNGFYKVETKTNASDITGTWTGRFKIGNNVWTKPLKIESIIPNKLAVTLKVADDYFNSGINPVSLSSEWLNGVKASGLKAEIYARYLSKEMKPEAFTDYTFRDSQYYTATSQEKIWTGMLDENGNAQFNVTLDAGKNVSGMLNAIFETRVYEPSGAYSIETKKFDFSPFSRYVGLKLPKSDDEYREVLYTDKTHKADIVLVDEKGKLISGNAELEFKVYKLEWLWWWVRDTYSKASYDEKRSATQVLSKRVSVKNGRASVDFQIKDWGRYLFVVSDPQGKHTASTISYIDYSYWASRNNSDVEGSSTMLLLTSNKDTYNTKETAEVTFNANKNSTAYITIEKNGAVIKQDIVRTVDGSNTYTFKTDTSMAPNVYVHIALVQEYAQTTNSLPIRLYGIIPIMVEDAATRLTPVIKSAQTFVPNGECTINVSEKTGRPATFTLAVVDEGLLGLTAFKTANPWDYFYSKESSQLASYDIFDLVSAAINGELKTLISVGGSDASELTASKDAERFKPVVFYFGPFELKKGESKSIKFKMPEYIGEVRLMAVMADRNSYGIAEEKVKVKSDVMLSPTLPRTLGVDETMELPVTVFNTTDKNKNISIAMNATGALHAKENLNVQLEALSNKTVSFKVHCDKAGTGEISFVAKEGSRELSRSTTEIAVMSRGINYETEKIISLKAGTELNELLNTPGENGSKSLHIEVSKTQPIGVEKHLDYLLSFPHGCIEQITSKAFAQLYLDKMLHLDATSVSNIKNNIQSVISRYPNYQLSNGGFTYWQGGTYENLWASAFVLHFLTEAKRAGYYVDDSIYTPLVKHLKSTANTFSASDRYDINSQSYRLYALALIGEANPGAMNRLRNEKEISPYARALLALSYAISGNKAQGEKMFADIAHDFPSYRKTGSDFSSSLRDLAITCLVAKKLNDSTADARFTALSKAANAESWLSTQEAAWLLITASNFYSKHDGSTAQYEIKLDEQNIKTAFDANSQMQNITLNDAAQQKVRIKNSGTATLFVSLRYKSKIASGSERAKSSGISIRQKFFRDSEEVPVMQIKHGDSFKVQLAVKNESISDLDNLVLTFPIPTGWEISNERLGGETANSDYSSLDIRDEVIYLHFDLAKGATKTFAFNASASYGGEYFVPAVSCEAMYDAAINANTVGIKVNALRK